jgi:hypothetical protein
VKFSPEIDDLLRVWNEMSSAMQAVECALPKQMTAAIERMEAMRYKMGPVVNAAAMASFGPRRRDDITAPPPRGPGDDAL